MKKHLGSVIFVLMALFCFEEALAFDGVIARPPQFSQREPDLVVVPSDSGYAYMVPGVEGVYSSQGMWYRQYGGIWYTSPVYNGIWTPIMSSAVPIVVIDIPPTYALYLPDGYQRIHYVEYHRHWREWDRGRYWHHQPWYGNYSNRYHGFRGEFNRNHGEQGRGHDMHRGGEGRVGHNEQHSNVFGERRGMAPPPPPQNIGTGRPAGPSFDGAHDSRGLNAKLGGRLGDEMRRIADPQQQMRGQDQQRMPQRGQGFGGPQQQMRGQDQQRMPQRGQGFGGPQQQMRGQGQQQQVLGQQFRQRQAPQQQQFQQRQAPQQQAQQRQAPPAAKNDKNPADQK